MSSGTIDNTLSALLLDCSLVYLVLSGSSKRLSEFWDLKFRIFGDCKADPLCFLDLWSKFVVDIKGPSVSIIKFSSGIVPS